MEASLFADPAALTAALHKADQWGEHYQFLLADHTHLPEAIEREILAVEPELCSSSFCKVSLDWADGLPHGNETLWDTVLSRPVTWRKLSELLQPATETAVSTSEAVHTEAAGSQGKVLLVEDAPALQWVTQSRLQKLGYRVKVASNGREAIEAIEGEQLRTGADGYPDARDGRYYRDPDYPQPVTPRTRQTSPSSHSRPTP